MLWEVDLWRGREEDPAQDFLLACLWDGFERELLRVFPDAQEIVTPHEPNYDTGLWAAFLAERGYTPHVESTHRKMLDWPARFADVRQKRSRMVFAQGTAPSS
jgi:hypothetical protein